MNGRIVSQVAVDSTALFSKPLDGWLEPPPQWNLKAMVIRKVQVIDVTMMVHIPMLLESCQDRLL